MKKLLFLLSSILILSCEKEDSELGYTAVGTYQLISAKKFERVYSGDSQQNVSDVSHNLYNECSRKSILTIKSNGTFEKMDYVKTGENCELNIIKGKWPNKTIIYNNELGEFKVDNSTRVYEVFSKGTNKSLYTVDKVDLTYGSILDDPSERYIFTYIRMH